MMRFLAVLALLSGGCAGLLLPSREPVARLDALRAKGRGVCAGSLAGPRLTANATVEACVRTGSPGTLYDSDKPFLTSIVRGADFIDANPGSWKVTVIRDDGVKVVDKVMEDRVPEIGTCSSHGCNKIGVASDEASEPWRVGFYTLRYTFIHDTVKTAEMKITLTN